jgi:hypothetical protein
MSFDRTTIKSGPAILTWNGGSIYFKKGLTVEEGFETFDVEVDVFAGADKRRGSVLATIKGGPSGQWTNLGIWFPWLGALRGARMHGATDKAAVIKWLDGEIWTYHNAALLDMPDLILSATKTIMDGSLALECRTKNNTDPTDAASFVTRTTGSFTDTSFDWADVPTQSYLCSWGESPWDSFSTREGVKIKAKVKWNDFPTDEMGVVEKELDMLEVTASFTPMGIAQADLDAKLAMQNSASAARGARMADLATDLIISGTGVYVLMRKAFMRKLPMQSGTDGKGRHGEIEAVSTLGITTGAAEAMLFLGTEEPA